MSVSAIPQSPTLRVKGIPVSQGAVLIPVFAGFVMPGTPSWAFIFYLTAIPPVLLQLWRGWRPNLRHPTLAAMLAMLVWSALTIAWNHYSPHGKTTMFWIVNSLWTLVLVFNFLAALNEEPRTRSRLICVLVYGGAINALVSLALFAAQGDITARLWGYGVTSNPVMGSAMMDICLLLALGAAREEPALRLPMAAAALPMLGFLAFSYSRTALLAIAAAGLLISLGGRPLLAMLTGLVIAAAGAVWWKFGQTLFPDLWANLASRGADCHAQLWAAGWRAISQRPVIGYGPSAVLPKTGLTGPFCPPYPSPHDLYLCILYYTGAIGLALFLITVALLWWQLRAATKGFDRRLWLAVGLVPLIVGISDLIQIIKGPSPMWYIFWMPMLLILTLPTPRWPSLSATTASLRAGAHRSAPREDERRRYVR